MKDQFSVDSIGRQFNLDAATLKWLEEVCKGVDLSVQVNRNYLTEAEFLAAFHLGMMISYSADPNYVLPNRLPDHLIQFIKDHSYKQQSRRQQEPPSPHSPYHQQGINQTQPIQATQPAMSSPMWNQTQQPQPSHYAQSPTHQFNYGGQSSTPVHNPMPSTFYTPAQTQPSQQGGYPQPQSTFYPNPTQHVSSIPNPAATNQLAFNSMVVGGQGLSPEKVIQFIKNVEEISAKIRMENERFSEQLQGLENEEAGYLNEINQLVGEISRFTSTIKSTITEINSVLSTSNSQSTNAKVQEWMVKLIRDLESSEQQYVVLKKEFIEARAKQEQIIKNASTPAPRYDYRHSHSTPDQPYSNPIHSPAQTFHHANTTGHMGPQPTTDDEENPF